MMPLNGYKSLCQEQQAIIVSSEQGRQHRAINSDRCFVTHYQIDGAAIQTGLSCDYLLINKDKSDAYLVELKGTDIEHAVDQLEFTAQILKLALQNYHIKYRLVHAKARTHALMETKFKKFCQCHREPGEFLHRENMLAETI